MGYIGEITRQGNVPENIPLEWPENEPERTEKFETISTPVEEPEKVAV